MRLPFVDCDEPITAQSAAQLAFWLRQGFFAPAQLGMALREGEPPALHFLNMSHPVSPEYTPLPCYADGDEHLIGIEGAKKSALVMEKKIFASLS
jgi:hypothetical protein